MKYAAIVGVYDLEETITSFDPAWGDDLTGHRFTAVLTLAGGVGTFADLQLRNAEGKVVGSVPNGAVTFDPWPVAGSLVLNLGSRNHSLVVRQIDDPTDGQAGSRQFTGGINVGGHISGQFVARRRSP